MKIAFWSLLMMLGLFMIVSALTGMNVALTQSDLTNTTTVETSLANPTPTTQATTKHVIGLRFNKGNWSDPYNNAVWQGVANALRETPSATFDVVLYNETSPLSNDVDLLFTTGDSLGQLERDARTYPETEFVVVDNENVPLATTPRNVHKIMFEEQKTSYLLGYLAGTLSQTGHIGFIGDTKTERTLANQAAFLQGLLAACAACQLHSEFVASSDDPALGANAAQTVIRKGADILFADAGNSSQGVITYVNDTMCASVVKSRPSPLTSALTMVAKNINYLSRCAGSYPIFFIGNGRYQPSLGDNDDDPTSLNHGLTSLAKHVDLAVYKTIQTLAADDTLETSQLALRDNAVSITLDDYNRALIPDEVLTQLETIKSRLISGDIVLNTVTTQ